jgi:hypothetical protein
MVDIKKLEKKLHDKAFPKKKRAKQQVHIRLINNKNVLAGRGKKDIWVGRMVWYKGEVYQVIRLNKETKFRKLYTIANRTKNKIVENVSPSQWRIYS